MRRRYGGWARSFAVGSALLVTPGVAAVPAGPAAAAPAPTLADQVGTLAAAGRSWRAELAPALKEFSSAVSLTGKVQGAVTAGTVTLPATLELTGDTTIVARELVVATGAVRVRGHGHTLRLFPVSDLRTGDAAPAGKPIRIDASAGDAAPGQGTPGTAGTEGIDGLVGPIGSNGFDGSSSSCDGGTGFMGDGGGLGTAGGAGGIGGPGEAATNVTLDIPDTGSDAVEVAARGGTGGTGGKGGKGGKGGPGGKGGSGGNGYLGECPGGFGGNGGSGGTGGTGGTGGAGGAGGDGGVGGKGGDVSLTVPLGFDPADADIDNAGGSGGAVGAIGERGQVGAGGAGGDGGWGLLGQAASGMNGLSGSDGAPLGTGVAGATGGAGAVTMTPRCTAASQVKVTNLAEDSGEFSFDLQCTPPEALAGAKAGAAPVSSAVRLGKVTCKYQIDPPTAGMFVKVKASTKCTQPVTTLALALVTDIYDLEEPDHKQSGSIKVLQQDYHSVQTEHLCPRNGIKLFAWLTVIATPPIPWLYPLVRYHPPVQEGTIRTSFPLVCTV